MRRFHSYGPLDIEEHYYAPRKELIKRAYTQLTGEHPKKGRSLHYSLGTSANREDMDNAANSPSTPERFRTSMCLKSTCST